MSPRAAIVEPYQQAAGCWEEPDHDPVDDQLSGCFNRHQARPVRFEQASPLAQQCRCMTPGRQDRHTRSIPFERRHLPTHKPAFRASQDHGVEITPPEGQPPPECRRQGRRIITTINQHQAATWGDNHHCIAARRGEEDMQPAVGELLPCQGTKCDQQDHDDQAVP